MEKSISAYQFKSVYEDLGYDIGRLGCIMADIEPRDLERRVVEAINPDEVYYSPDETDHTNGIVAGEPHITLLYGLLRPGPELKKHVLTMLDGGDVLLEMIEIDRVGYFESQKDDERYFAIVAHVKITPELQEANERLKFLPHINTFPGYKAHMTLAYIKPDERARDRIIESLSTILEGRFLSIAQLNFGD